MEREGKSDRYKVRGRDKPEEKERDKWRER